MPTDNSKIKYDNKLTFLAKKHIVPIPTPNMEIMGDKINNTKQRSKKKRIREK